MFADCLSIRDRSTGKCDWCCVAARPADYPSIRKKLWGGALWSPSYFAGSCGGAPIAVIRQYIEQQQTPH